MDRSKMESISSVDEPRDRRHRGHWTMKYDGRSVRSLKTHALIHHALDLDDDDDDDFDMLPSYKDGPVSVQEAESTMTNSGSDGSSQSATSVICVANKSVPSGDYSAKQSKLKDEPKSQNGHFVENIKIETECTRKATCDQVKEKVLHAVTELRKLEEYHHGDGVKYQKIISDIFWEYGNERVLIGDYLADLGYAELTITMLKQMNMLGIFKNDDIWFPTYYTYKTCWNYSDASETLATSLAEAGIIRLMTLNLSHKAYLGNIHSKNVYYILKASVSTLHNIARCAGVMSHFKEMKTVEVILPLTSSSDDFIKSVALLTLAYLVEEKDSAIIDETKIIKHIVGLLHGALESKRKGRLRGLTPTELTQGLARLAVIDSNKRKITDEGALPDFVSMLQSTDLKEQTITTDCLWALSFDKNVKPTIIDFPELLVALENLQDSENQIVRKNVRGALWLLKGENDLVAKSTNLLCSNKSKSHIFISFSLSEKDLVKKLCASLAAEGYRLWVDWDQMGGSSLKSMTKMVENAAVVLICMSERYKQSPSCRTEAEYTFLKRKDSIYLTVQKRYRPDGWLDDGVKPSFDFSDKNSYEKSLQNLLMELKSRGVSSQSFEQTHNTSLGKSVVSSSAPPAANTVTNISLPGLPPPPPPQDSNNTAILVSMSNENVENWLVSKGLKRLTSTFSQIDGQLIWQLRKMRETTPEYFYRILERQFGMTFIDILRFNAALDTLQ